MLKALLHSIEPGRICDVVPVGEEFEVAPGFSWVEVPDGTTTSDRYEDGEVIKFDPLTQPGFAENAYKIARGIAYQDFGNQLDMLFHELNTTGSISSDGPWATHIRNVKAAIPKDDPAAVLAWNQAHWASISGNTSPT